MEYSDFDELTRVTIRGMYDRIPEEYHEDFEGLFQAGELRHAVDMLLGGLTRLQLEITPAERDRLATLLQHLKEPESRLDSIVVA
ncbi:MAG: hypothetical protein ACRDT4_12135 [Micromonosporaceae bacterium]